MTLYKTTVTKDLDVLKVGDKEEVKKEANKRCCPVCNKCFLDDDPVSCSRDDCPMK